MKPENGYSSGYTFNHHHITLSRAKQYPAAVAKGAKDLIGLKAKSLL